MDHIVPVYHSLVDKNGYTIPDRVLVRLASHMFIAYCSDLVAAETLMFIRYPYIESKPSFSVYPRFNHG